jgi:hypothetical protein
MKVFRALGIAPLALLLCSGIALAQEPFTPGQWTALNNAPPNVVGHIQLLTDGSVLAINTTCGTAGTWYRLVPDSTGSYVNGKWSSGGTLPAGYNPLYFASQVLPNGNLVAIGGEYNGSATGCNGVETTLGALYNPHSNKWVSLAAPPGWTSVGDADSVLLPSGKMMLANCCSKQEAILTLVGTTPTWTTTGTGKFDSNSEEGWTLLPNGKILTVDAYVGSFNATGTNSELYTPSTGSWASAGSTVKQLWDSEAPCKGSPSYEVGPALLRPDGSVFATGANGCGAGHTAIYKGGKWTAGPDFPGTFNVADGPAALLPDGNVLVMASPGIYQTGSQFFEFDGSVLNTTSAPANAPVDSSYYGNMIVLPTGQILFTDTSQSVEVYTPAGTACAGCEPTVTSVASTLTHGSKNNVIQGTQLNGLSFGAAYGDDSQNTTNFPLVRITDAAGHVVYCRTHGWPSAVATKARIVSAQFDVPGTIALGPGTLELVANGIASAGVAVTID